MRHDDSKLMYEAYVASMKLIKEDQAMPADEAEECQCDCCKAKRSSSNDEDCECMNERPVPSMQDEEGVDHDETDLSNPEEAHEVRIGKAILSLCKDAYKAGHHFEEEGKIEQLAKKLIDMHMK